MVAEGEGAGKSCMRVRDDVDCVERRERAEEWFGVDGEESENVDERTEEEEEEETEEEEEEEEEEGRGEKHREWVIFS